MQSLPSEAREPGRRSGNLAGGTHDRHDNDVGRHRRHQSTLDRMRFRAAKVNTGGSGVQMGRQRITESSL
jgi:hypothetical protein